MSVLTHRKPDKEASQDASDDSDSDPSLLSMMTLHRFKRPIGISTILYFLYMISPLAMVLFWGRLAMFFLSQLLFLITPAPIDRMILSIFYNYIMGWLVYHNEDPATERPHIIVANHQSEIDGMVFLCKDAYHQVTISPLYFLLPSKVGLVYLGKNKWNTDDPKDRLQRVLKQGKMPLIAFSEGGFTNAKVGLMAFSKFVYSLPGLRIQPATIRVNNPWPVEHDAFGSHPVFNYFYMFTTPWFSYEITYLDPTTKEEEEGEIEYARRVQVLIADELGVVPTKHLYKHKKILAKELYG